MCILIQPTPEAIFYKDEKLYVCLASFPVTKGHSIVVWKKDVKDLHSLNRKDYEYLMDKVDQVRNVLLRTLNVEKVYLVYMDEIQHVHWHLIPRYNEEGFNVFKHNPEEIKDFSLARQLRLNFGAK